MDVNPSLEKFRLAVLNNRNYFAEIHVDSEPAKAAEVYLEAVPNGYLVRHEIFLQAGGLPYRIDIETALPLRNGRFEKAERNELIWNRRKEGKTLKAIAEEFGISASNVRRVCWLYDQEIRRVT